MEYYYYDPTTGEFTMRFSKVYEFTDQPYIQKPKYWPYNLYRIDLDTGEPVEK